MKLISTTISGKTVQMRLANDPDPAKATEWIDFVVQVQGIEPPSVPLVAEAQIEAFRRLRDVMIEQSKDLAALANQRRE